MSSKLRRTLRKYLRRYKKASAVIVLAIIAVGAISYNEYMQHRRLSVDHTTYSALLGVIAKAESKGNYNAHFGNAANTSINFTAMTIGEVLQWQTDFVKQGSPSSAVGKYQFLNTTLSGLVEQLGIDKSQHFNQATQDQLAVALLERRGSEKYINKEITQQQFAENLAKEWAGLPKTTGSNPDVSYYDSDGLNKAQVSVKEVLEAIEPIKAK